MSYATFSDFNARYATRLSADEVSSHLLPYASARLEGRLGAHFAVPFSANNVTARDLTLDLAYLLVLQRGKGGPEAQALAADLDARVAALAVGRAPMLTDSGAALFATGARAGVWGNTAGATPRFDLTGDACAAEDPCDPEAP